MTTRTLFPVRTALASTLAARGAELRVLILAILATLLLCSTLLPVVGHDATVQREASRVTATFAAPGPLSIREETPARNPMQMALESWGEPHGLR